jgi:hypothetical protein
MDIIGDFFADALAKEYAARKNPRGVEKDKAAVSLPLRRGILSDSTIEGIFEEVDNETGTSSMEFPLDIIAPGQEDNYVGYTIPDHGYIPQRQVEGDYIMIPIFGVGNAIDQPIRYARNSQWGVVQRMLDALTMGINKKHSDDAWHTIIAAGYDRDLVVTDSDASQGTLSKRLISLMKVVMRRNGGGNSSSMDRRILTDLYLSPEAHEGMRSWNLDEIDEVTRREIYVASDGDAILTRVFGVNLHQLDELGYGQEYENYYEDTLSGSIPSGKSEIVVGLDLNHRDSFISPVDTMTENGQMVGVYPDDSLHRQARFGWYARSWRGWAVADNRNVLLGAL